MSNLGTLIPYTKENPGQRHTQKHPNGYLTPKLKRFLKKQIKYEDPETQELIKGNVGDALMWRYILNGTQGDNQAIEGILDRVDGRLKPDEDKSESNNTYVFVIQTLLNKAQNIPDWILEYANKNKTN